MGNELYNEHWSKQVNRLIKEYDFMYLTEFKNFNTKLSYRTIYNYIQYIIAFWAYTKKHITKTTIDDYTSYFASIRYTSPSNQTNAHAALKKYCYYLFATKKISENYMDLIERPNATERQSTIDKRAKGYLTKEEMHKYIDNIRSKQGVYSNGLKADYWKSRDLFMIELFLSTGLRLSGLWKLNVQDIDFEKKELITTEKRGKVRRYPLSESLLCDCKAWLIDRAKLVSETEKALFISTHHQRLGTMQIATIVKSYAQNIEGKKITPHKLRATYGTQVYDATKDIYLTQQAMGHNSPQTTELYVRGQENKSMNKASEIMSKLIF